MGQMCTHLLAYFFDAAGNLLDREHRAWNHPVRYMDGHGTCMASEQDHLPALVRQLKDWRAELGFWPVTIRVKRFLDDDYPVGIELMPEHLGAVALWADDDEDMLKIRDWWVDQGQFVWWWDRDYYISKDGAVVGS
jgi:hypothetical protein